MRVIMIGGLLVLAGCGRNAGEYKASSGPPPEVVKAMQIPPSPYYIIYSPPVDLAKKKA
ncbi:MAG TPA: hypothetical protein VGQ06_00765 [Gemmatimonadales bacterium]|jgi:hypothetical protein|nr:hypothetical protein [Gemmatimonadales bacterium]